NQLVLQIGDDRLALGEPFLQIECDECVLRLLFHPTQSRLCVELCSADETREWHARDTEGLDADFIDHPIEQISGSKNLDLRSELFPPEPGAEHGVASGRRRIEVLATQLHEQAGMCFVALGGQTEDGLLG